MAKKEPKMEKDEEKEPDKLNIPVKTKEMVSKDDVPLDIQARIIRKQLDDDDLEPTSKEAVALEIKLRDVEKALARKRLEKRLRELDSEESDEYCLI